MLKLENITSAYGAVEVLRHVSLTIAPGEILGLLGRNGAGKTTLLKTIMGLIKARSRVSPSGSPANSPMRRFSSTLNSLNSPLPWGT